MFLLVPAYPGCPGQTAVKWLLSSVNWFLINRVIFDFCLIDCLIGGCTRACVCRMKRQVSMLIVKAVKKVTRLINGRPC